MRDDRTYKIIGASLEVHKELGCGFMMPFEKAIGNCLLRSLGL